MLHNTIHSAAFPIESNYFLQSPHLLKEAVKILSVMSLSTLYEMKGKYIKEIKYHTTCSCQQWKFVLKFKVSAILKNSTFLILISPFSISLPALLSASVQFSFPLISPIQSSSPVKLLAPCIAFSKVDISKVVRAYYTLFYEFCSKPIHL